MVLGESQAVELRLGQIGVVWREGVERVVLSGSVGYISGEDLCIRPEKRYRK
jgi:hypothetical protein